MQNVEGSLKTFGFECGQTAFGRVEQMGIDALALQGGENGAAAIERHFALGGKTAGEYGYFTDTVHGGTFCACGSLKLSGCLKTVENGKNGARPFFQAAFAVCRKAA